MKVNYNIVNLIIKRYLNNDINNTYITFCNFINSTKIYLINSMYSNEFGDIENILKYLHKTKINDSLEKIKNNNYKLNNLKKFNEYDIIIFNNEEKKEIDFKKINSFLRYTNHQNKKFILVSSLNLIDEVKKLKNFNLVNYYTPYHYDYSIISGLYKLQHISVNKCNIINKEIINKIKNNKDNKNKKIIVIKLEDLNK